jgi:diguanylate cyclase (GGDEF)-like protein
MTPIAPVMPGTPNRQVHERFLKEPDLLSLPVVKDKIPVGLINRYAFLDTMTRLYSLELYGKKPCETFMNRNIMVVDHNMSIHELSKLMVESDPRHILHGFIVTCGSVYAGMGSGHDLMREITRMQIHAARYANPLTQLPGNVSINEHLDQLLEQGVPFQVCYCDLDHFKPYNDVYGYQKGDEVIHWTGRLLEAVCDPERDFVGHIGGDDFLLAVLSEDWEARCRRVLSMFQSGREQFFSAEDMERGGYESEDRLGRLVFHPLLSISIGVVLAPSGVYASHHEISAAAAQAKKQAKGLDGCSLFVDRRKTRPERIHV